MPSRFKRSSDAWIMASLVMVIQSLQENIFETLKLTVLDCILAV
jgi:hypothetical protein